MIGPYDGFMAMALRAAARGRGSTGPNPRVGAVVVRGSQVVGVGFHAVAGGPHAEVGAIQAAGRKARGATLVVTLEPCSHHGRTPPCTDLIRSVGIARVVIGTLDPNPRERGAGAAVLEACGIQVVHRVREAACRRLVEAYAKYITTGLPFVTVKLASSLDGRIATHTGDARWLSDAPFRRLVHRMRGDVQAVAVGAHTAVRDDPDLTVRLVASAWNPLRVLYSSRLEVPADRKLFQRQDRHPTVVLTTRNADPRRKKALEALGVSVCPVSSRDGRVDLLDSLCELGRRQVAHLLVEGGAGLAGQFLQRGLADRLMVAYSPLLLGTRARPLVDWPGVDRVGDSLWFPVEKVRKVGRDTVVSLRAGPDWTVEAWKEV
jgi:diaminohydroxyphosphoribosylaminopyrimidine deaminase/5-amino-6-(5-phosphoribosylamino)uracil reductase